MPGRKVNRKFDLLWGAVVSIAVQLLLTALIAVPIQRGVLPIGKAQLWEALISLAAGMAAAASSRKGEGRNKALLISCFVPLLLILIAGGLLSAKTKVSFGIPVSAIFASAPSLIMLAVKKSGRRAYKGKAGKRKSRVLSK